eukprot:1228916-Rhodomonas_salina.1
MPIPGGKYGEYGGYGLTIRCLGGGQGGPSCALDQDAPYISDEYAVYRQQARGVETDGRECMDKGGRKRARGRERV